MREYRAKGGRASSPTQASLENLDSSAGGEGFASEDVDASAMGERSWWDNRDAVLKQYPSLWEEYGDRPRKRSGGERLEDDDV